MQTLNKEYAINGQDEGVFKQSIFITKQTLNSESTDLKQRPQNKNISNSPVLRT